MRLGVFVVSCVLAGYLSVSTDGKRVRYDGDEVWKITPLTTKDLDVLVKLSLKDSQLDFWRGPTWLKEPVYVQVPARAQSELRLKLALAGLVPEVTIGDVQATIEEGMKSVLDTRSTRSTPRRFDYGSYNTLSEINGWMEQMTSLYPNLVSLFNISTSYEGRLIQAIKITGNKSEGPKPGFFFNGGLHGREWISPATVIYMAGQLIEQYGTDPYLTRLVDAFDWYVLPVFNVDGYEYTWTTDRLWRKNRSVNGDGDCVGVDLNRNWDWKWCTIGSSKNPCSWRYCGTGPASEAEIKDVSDFLKAVPGRFKAYIDFHGFTQAWLFPWGYSKHFPENFIKQDQCSSAATTALESVNGTTFKHGTIAQTLYRASGTSSDWTFGQAKIPFSLTVELRDTGKYGFLLPANQIIPSGEETLQALLAYADCIL